MNAPGRFSHWHIIRTPWGGEIPPRWIVWHVLEHELQDGGEIFLILGLMGMKAPDIQ